MNNNLDMSVQGKMLSEWKTDLNNKYSIAELYRIVRDGGDLQKFVLREQGLITLD